MEHTSHPTRTISKKESIEPCDICGMEYDKEMCKIAEKFFQDDDPCFCKSIKKAQKAIADLKKARQEISYLNSLLSDAEESGWDLESMYKDFRDGTWNGQDIGGGPNKKMASWFAQRHGLNEENLE